MAVSPIDRLTVLNWMVCGGQLQSIISKPKSLWYITKHLEEIRLAKTPADAAKMRRIIAIKV